MFRKKVVLFLSIFFVCANFVHAQDMLYYLNGKTLNAKILVVSPTEISFKKAENPTGPTYFESIKAIQKIVYENGVVEEFNASKAAPAANTPTAIQPKVETANSDKKPIAYNYKKNAVTYNIFDAVFRRISFSYERIFANGYLAVQVPISFGLGSNAIFDVDYLNSYSNSNNNSNTYYYSSNYIPANETKYKSILRKNTFGVEVMAYPFGQHPVSMYVGPGFHYGLVDYEIEETVYFPIYNQGYNTYSSYVNRTKGSCVSYSGMVNVGMVVNSSENFILKLQIGLGFRQNQTEFDDYAATIVSPSFHVGYKF